MKQILLDQSWGGAGQKSKGKNEESQELLF
jgi:hypothetical protein